MTYELSVDAAEIAKRNTGRGNALLSPALQDSGRNTYVKLCVKPALERNKPECVRMGRVLLKRRIKMSICRGCGGAIGIDCFNPQECEWISNNQKISIHQDYSHLNQQTKHIIGEIKKLVDDNDENANIVGGNYMELVSNLKKILLDNR